MTIEVFSLSEKVWLYSGNGGWYFLSIPKYESNLIHDIYKNYQNKFGSLKVNASIGDLNWNTSIFFDTKKECYLLPLKSEIRKKGNIKEGDIINFTIKVL